MTNYWVLIVVAVFLLSIVAGALTVAAGSRDVDSCIAAVGLGTGAAMTAVGAVGMQRHRMCEAQLDAVVAAETAGLDDELAGLLGRGEL